MANTGFLRDWKWFWDNGQSYVLNQNVSKTSTFNLTVKEAKENYSIDHSLLSGLADNEMIANDAINFKTILGNILGVDINDMSYNKQKIIVVGSFNNVNGQSYNNIVMLNSDLTIDTSFNCVVGTDDIINCVHVDFQGRIYIGGWFTSYNGTPINNIARINTNGSIDTTFSSGIISSSVSNINNVVYSIRTNSTGTNIFVGGRFLYSTSSFTASLLVRLNFNGTHSGFFVGTSNLDYAVIRSIDTYEVDANNVTVFAVGENFDVMSSFVNGNSILAGYVKNTIVINSAGYIDTSINNLLPKYTGAGNDDNINKYYAIRLTSITSDNNGWHVGIFFGGYNKSGNVYRSVLTSLILDMTNKIVRVSNISVGGSKILTNPTIFNIPKVAAIRLNRNNRIGNDSKIVYVLEHNSGANFKTTVSYYDLVIGNAYSITQDYSKTKNISEYMFMTCINSVVTFSIMYFGGESGSPYKNLMYSEQY